MVLKNRETLLSHISGKNVALCCHWDADGVASGALLYHLIKSHTKTITTLSKGDPFLVEPKDVPGNPEIIICTDIQPSPALPPEKVIYIDHHPMENTSAFLHTIHNPQTSSCSLLIWDELVKDTKDPYFVFLTLLGYFGDGGNRETIPAELHVKANQYVPELMQKKASYYDKGYYLEVEKYVSALNVGKRMHWSGELPLALLKDIKHFEPFVYNYHPLAQEIQSLKQQLRNFYQMNVELADTRQLQYGVIECNKNIQGVLCARHMNGKPVMILNKYNGNVIGSLRVPENHEFDAGVFLSQFNGKIPTFLGGGHEKAGGFTMTQSDLPSFMEMMKEQ